MDRRQKIYLALWVYSLIVVGATFCLIFLGGQVKSHEAGLAVPDWPLTYGENPITYPFAKWTGNIFHEHFHRLWAGSVATLVLLQALLLWFLAPRRWLRWMGAAALLTVLLQATLGGLTVWYKLPWYISSAHGSLAQTFFAITIIISFGLYGTWRAIPPQPVPAPGPGTRRSPLFRGGLAVIALIYLQLFLGAVMRHTESGLAIPDFPAMANQWIPWFSESSLAWVNDWRFEHTDALGLELPDVTLGQIWIHFAHRAGALVVLLAIGALALGSFLRRQTFPKLFAAGGFLWVLVLLQVFLGVLTVWTGKHPWITSFHVVTGASVLGAAVFFTLRAWRCLEPVRQQEAPAGEERPARRQRRPKTLPADRSRAQAYKELVKPRIVYMVLVTTTLGYALGRGGLLPIIPLLHALIGTALSAAGASTLNQVIERDRDALMNRTRNRPIPLGQISLLAGSIFGVTCVLAGYAYLLFLVNFTAALCAFTSAALYVGIYTPLKQYSWLNTTVGAVPGAIPPLIGWAAATGQLNLGGWVLFAILFLWQHPHFFSIAWMYREDYARGGLKMLPVVKPDGVSTFRQSLTFAVLLVPVSLLPTFVRLVGWPYFVGALLCGIWFLMVCVRWRMTRSNQDARRVLLASVIYLPLLLMLIFVDNLIN